MARPTSRARVAVAGVALAMAAALAAPFVGAQQWSVYTGAAGRVDFNDNYFFVAPGQASPTNPGVPDEKESAFTLSLTPFVAASRRTEVSDVTALLAIGANKVWGISPSEDYLSGRFSLDGALREERASWTGRMSYARSSSLEETIRGTELVLVRSYTDTGALEGSYIYQLTDRWTAGVTAGGYANWYDSVQGGDTLYDDFAYNVSGNIGYTYSDQTRMSYSLGYTYYASDLTRSSVLTTTIGVVHRYSSQLTLSGSVGGFWSDTTAKQNLPGQGSPIAAGESRNDSGPFFGGSITYAFSDATQVDVRASQGLAPSGAGTISESTNASASLLHRFSDRLTGRLGANYQRTTYPAALDSSISDKTLTAGAGLSYRLAERWSLDTGYQYTRSRYGQGGGDPSSNVVFVSVAYNWPGASISDWVGSPVDTLGMPVAGPIDLPDAGTRMPSAPLGTPSTPFDGVTLP